jgi:PcRGLX-like N-terminal RIFT barrel domain
MTELVIVGETPSTVLSRKREPVTFGAPLPSGFCRSLDALRLLDGAGHPIPLQSRILDRWRDGSVRWVLLDFFADTSERETQWLLRHEPGDAITRDRSEIKSNVDGENVFIDTSAARFEIVTKGDVLFRRVTCSDFDPIDSASSGFRAIGDRGRSWRQRIVRGAIEEPGPLRTVVLLEGEFLDGDHKVAVWRLRMHFFAGMTTARFEFTVRNPRAALHPQGYWDLGDPGSIHFRSIAFRLITINRGNLYHSLDPGGPLEPAGDTFVLHQRASGGRNWQSPVHVAADGHVHLDHPGYEARTQSGVSNGDRATPIVTLRNDRGELALAVPKFWENFPKRIDADSQKVTVEIFPETSAGLYELQGGEQKTHVFFVTFEGDTVCDVPLEWCRSPIRLRTTSAAYSAAGAIPPLASDPHEHSDRYERLIAPALDGDASFLQKREQIDEYGWRHFGDIYADHEAVRHEGPSLLVSHYNNQYDAVGAFAWHFMRTGDWRWWDLADDLARHVIDIDIYHTDEDRANYSGGPFWHTNHYISAGTATHRAFPKQASLPGGGPSNEHNYTSGLLLHHFLTGSAASAEAVVGLARWVLAMEDGARSRFRWIDRGPTGNATATYSADYQGPGRGAANSINALLDAHRLTGEAGFLETAERLIRRCVHPSDDPGAHDLLDAERRWSYTVFLQVLAKFVEYRYEAGRNDEMVDYAREALLTYARWMAVHERPYLDHPERLEFPTETWAAQDLRKADVFQFAAGYAEADERTTFLERRDAFFSYAAETLCSMPTARFARPLVLLLVNGFRVAFSAPPSSLPGSRRVYSPRIPFVPQRQRVKQRLAIIGALTGLILLLAVVQFFR